MEAIKHALRIFTEKIEDKGDVEQLRRENAKLKVEIMANKKQIKNMREEMDTLHHVEEELQSSMQRRNTREIATSPIKSREETRSTPPSASLTREPMRESKQAKGIKEYR